MAGTHPSDGLASDFVVTLLEDSTGVMWVGTDGDGLSRVVDGGITTFGKGSDLRFACVRTIVEDAEGTLWVGTAGGEG